jgi:sec-independent protein translocase protein TatA
MIPQIGIAEIAIILIIALIVFGPRKLPDLGRSLGRGLREFREGVSSISTGVEGEEDGGGDVDDHDPTRIESVAETAGDPAPETGAESVEVDVEEVPPPPSGTSATSHRD